MSAYVNGAGLVNENLSMSYDMDNRTHGFIGAPTSNALSYTSIGIYNNVPSDVSVTLTQTNESYRGARIWKWVATPTTANGVGWLSNANNPGIGVVTGGGGGNANTFTGHSIFYKPTEALASTPLFTNYSNIGGWGQGSLGSDRSVDMGDGWFRGEVIWFDTVTRSDGKYWAINPLRARLNQPITVYWAGPFRENSNRSGFVSDFAISDRSNTQCLIDQTGIHSPSVANMAYDNITGNLANFNGTTSRYIFEGFNSQVKPHSNTTSITWEVIYRKTGGGDFQGIFGGKVGAGCSFYCNGGIYLYSNSFQANWYDNSNYNFLNSGISPTLNQNHHVVVTFSGTDQRFRIYVDGIIRATSGVTNNNYGGSQEVYDIGFNSKNAFGGGGDSHHVTGRIPIVRQYYNKALTAAEVKQNYEAFKPRFSLL